MTALNTWHANVHFTAQSHSLPRPRGRALMRRTLVGAVKGASATAQQWPLPTSPTSINSLDRSVQQYIADFTHMHVAVTLTYFLVNGFIYSRPLYTAHFLAVWDEVWQSWEKSGEIFGHQSKTVVLDWTVRHMHRWLIWSFGDLTQPAAKY